MIFLNSTRPVDENVQYERSSFSVPKRRNGLDGSRMVLILMLFYLLASAFPLILYYPISMCSLIVPVIMLSYAVCIMDGDTNHDVWPCCLIGVIGIMIKLGGLIVYLSIFTLKGEDKFEKRYKSVLPETNAKTLFFGIMVGLEVLILVLSCCFKWHLVAFEKDKHRRKNLQKAPMVEEA